MTVIIQAPSVPTILGVIVSLLIVDVFAVCMRWYARRGLGQPLKLDDWLMIPCIIGLFSCASCLLHGQCLSPHEIVSFSQGSRFTYTYNGISGTTASRVRRGFYISQNSIRRICFRLEHSNYKNGMQQENRTSWSPILMLNSSNFRSSASLCPPWASSNSVSSYSIAGFLSYIQLSATCAIW